MFEYFSEVQLRFLLGPAGAGKTFRCLSEIGQELKLRPEGKALLLVAPKQSTYQLERQLLDEFDLPGYTRLQILSFERLAYLLFDQLDRAAPEMLDEEGRVMILRGLLAQRREQLKLFRASARLTGFAQQLSEALRELQRNQLTPESLMELATRVPDQEGLGYKLQDLAVLLREYLLWLKTHKLQDSDCLLTTVAEFLRQGRSQTPPQPSGGRARGRFSPPPGPWQSDLPGFDLRGANTGPTNWLEQVWVDGFGEWSAQELDLLAALAPNCQAMTLTFCLDAIPQSKASWLSSWALGAKTFEDCQKRLANLPGVNLSVQVIERRAASPRFAGKAVLEHLERCWSDPRPFVETTRQEAQGPCDPGLARFLRIASCANPEAEAVLAAREILAHVQAGGRFREVSVLVRKLEGYHEALQRVFSRYEIPFFMDRRQPVSHHPLAELTRSALRTVARDWLSDDWFAALKTGMVPASDQAIDELENQALARGWRGKSWHEPLRLKDEPKSAVDRERLQQLEARLESVRCEVIAPFQKLALATAYPNKTTGPQLAAALRAFWKELRVKERLDHWAEAEVPNQHPHFSNSVQATVWEVMNGWLENVELAFSAEALRLREWLPILEAGLANLTVGLIPPALDQVLIGAIDRSRNPEIQLAIVLGMNEAVFPARPQGAILLSDYDRSELEKQNVLLSSSTRLHAGRERFHAYVACTRARKRLVLTSALADGSGSTLNPSPFLSHLRRLFPALELESVPRALDWRESFHTNELVGPLLKALNSNGKNGHAGTVSKQEVSPAWAGFMQLPAMAKLLTRIRQLPKTDPDERLDPELAAQLYGPVLRTSVSKLEQFAACACQFFLSSGLRAEERKRFELDVREQGSFQHEALARFHQQLEREKKLWRDLTPREGRRRIGEIARELVAGYRDGLLQATEQTRFIARVLIDSLEDFVETLIDWMSSQYQFDPVAVELAFGEEAGPPAWEIEAGPPTQSPRLKLALQGRIDRVDLHHDSVSGAAHCVVLDYKSSQKQLDSLLIAHGLQLQLLAYLNVLRNWPDPRARFRAGRLIPAGVFYVNLRGKYNRKANRFEALGDTASARKHAYRHTGRFDRGILNLLDARSNAEEGDQFNFRYNKNGQIDRRCVEAMEHFDFETLLASVEATLAKMGQQIFSGIVQVSPYRKGTSTACQQCDYRAICRIDPWTHRYRVLRKTG